MKRIFRSPTFAAGIVLAALLASLAPIATSRVQAQVTVYQAGGYYSPYGQGPYGGYVQGYAAPFRAPGNIVPSYGGMFGRRVYGYSGYGNVPYGYGNRVQYGIGPPVRVYGGASYYQPAYGPVYSPYGYGY